VKTNILAIHAHPDDVEKFAIPASPKFTNQRPLGDEGK